MLLTCYKMVVLKRLYAKLGSHSTGIALVEAMPSRKHDGSDMGIRIGSVSSVASILSNYWIKCSCLPLCSMLLAEDE